ncbi:MAG: glycosyl transferase family 1, partial [Methylovulum sp.]
AASHFLVLPSGLEEAGGMRENFGNVVAEAMAAGRPVLVAKGLAWDHLDVFGAGFVFARTEASVCAVLRKAQALDHFAWQQMSWNDRQYVEHQLNPVKLGDQVWQALMGAGPANRPQQLAEGSLYE